MSTRKLYADRVGVNLHRVAGLTVETLVMRDDHRARQAIVGAEQAFLSVASCWELAFKVSIGKLTLTSSVERFLPEQLAVNRFELLHIDLVDAARVGSLPWHHRDPFDRLLAVQALHGTPRSSPRIGYSGSTV